MKRQMALLDYALGALRRQARKNIALTLGLALVVAMFAATLFTTDSLRYEYELSAQRMPDITVQRLVAGRPALIPVLDAIRLRDIPTVRSVTPRVWGYHYLTMIESNVTIVGIGEASPEQSIALSAGRLPTRNGEIAIGWVLSEHLGLRVGDHLTLGSVDARGVPAPRSEVVGRFGDESAIRSADMIVATPAHARTLLGVPDGMATDLLIDLTTEDESRVVRARIAERIDGARVLERQLLERTYELTFDTRAGMLSVWLLPALLAFLLLAWERLSGLGPSERREIGILKAIGWGTNDVLAARMWSSAAIATVGCASGIVVAYLFVYVFEAPGLLDAILGWSAVHPPMELTPAFDATQLFAILGAVVVPFVGVSVVPAWRAAMIDPHQAVRGEQ